MKGKIDISRDTFRKEYHYNKVQMQQGRVQVDADWNEQVDIQDYHNKTSLRDVVGKSGAPIENAGFAVTISADGKLMAEPGRYYVDGILIENEKQFEIIDQIDLPVSLEDKKEGKLRSDDGKYLEDKGTYLLYLDVWERPVVALDAPKICESALNGIDTAARSKIVWQVKLLHVKDGTVDCTSIDPWDSIKPASTSTLQAFCKPEEPPTDRCMIPPGAGYRGLENQLYRVEVHDPGKAGDKATVKWSRDNGTVVTKLANISGGTLTVTSGGKDKLLGFGTGDWVEITDDISESWGKPGSLLKLTYADDHEFQYDVSSVADPPTNEKYPREFNPKIRRWDSNGVIDVKALSPIQLEDGIEVTFKEGTLQTGDYWLIPARTIKGNIEWPLVGKEPDFRSPEGIEHHYCSLGLVQYLDTKFTKIADCRKFFHPLVDLEPGPDGGPISRELVVHTGLIDLNFKVDPPSSSTVNFKNFIHYYADLKSPPAIILALVGFDYRRVSDGGSAVPPPDDEKVSSMEDHCLYVFNKKTDPNALPIPEFKPVNITLKTFDIVVNPAPPPGGLQLASVKLRWWAVPAEEKDLQVQDEEGSGPTVPSTIEFDPSVLTVDGTATIKITDPQANTDVRAAEDIVINLTTGETPSGRGGRQRKGMDILISEVGENKGIFLGKLNIRNGNKIIFENARIQRIYDKTKISNVISESEIEFKGTKPLEKIVIIYNTAADNKVLKAEAKVEYP
jgi:Family of unknown function (DUF6519)